MLYRCSILGCGGPHNTFLVLSWRWPSAAQDIACQYLPLSHQLSRYI